MDGQAQDDGGKLKRITDKEMLDWMIKESASVEFHKGDYWVSGTDIPAEKTGRKAIIAAIKASRRRP